MEKIEEAIDDQGSGWFEVKKKHRNNSKFSLQSWVGGFAGKNASTPLGNQPSLSENIGYSHGKCRSQLPKGGDCAVHSKRSYANSVPASSEDKQCVSYVHTGVGRNESECPKSSQTDITNLKDENKFSEKVPVKDDPTVVHKINGDLEDNVLVALPENALGAGIKFGAIGDDNLLNVRENGNDHNLVSCVFSCTTSQENNMVAASASVDTVSHEMPLLTPKDEQFHDKCKEVNKIPMKDSEALIVSEKIVDLDPAVSNCKDIHAEDVKPVNDNCLSVGTPSGEEAGMQVKLQSSIVNPEIGDPEISEVPISVEGPSELVLIDKDTELVLGDKSGSEISEESTLTASLGDRDVPEDGASNDNISSTQNMITVGESQTGESKERFRQRLWCFLFENLNRAVDELYLLCELECDLEQMKEAILVLEEAASDFKDLNARVEEFEKTKRSSSQCNDGVPIALKSDHRRPHALSWEVRRMTTSAHKAEILSSSLEAFKKIQQERATLHPANNVKILGPGYLNLRSCDGLKKSSGISDGIRNAKDSIMKSRKQSRGSNLTPEELSGEKLNTESIGFAKVNTVQNGNVPLQVSSSGVITSRLPPRDSSTAGKYKREQLGSEADKVLTKKDKVLTEGISEKNPKLTDHGKKHIPICEQDKEKEKRHVAPWKSMNAWKEKRNWEDILSSPCRVSSRVSNSPSMSRKSAERARMLHDKLMSPEKKKKTAVDLRREAEEKHARAMRIRSELENERVQKLQRTSEKLNRVNEWQAVRNMKLREGMYARHQRSESRHEAFLAQVVRRAGDESSKVNEVRFITSLNEENKKLILRQKLHDSELRRAEKLQVIKTKQKEDMAREEAVLERRRLIEAEKLQRLAETQRRKEEAQVRREEEPWNAGRALEERRRAQQEEAELLAQKLAERLSESEQRRKFYLEQIRERASMDFRDQSSPLLRRSVNKEGQGKSTQTSNNEENQASNFSGLGCSNHTKERQRLMALKYEFPEPPTGAETTGIGYRTAMGTARVKIGRWLQELQRLRQARKEGAASIGLIAAEMIKYLEGKDAELQASRQAGLLDFIASALPASHTSKPEACQVTMHLLKLLRVVLSVSANRSYFLAQNLLPPIIPMLSAALENYIKIAASLNQPANTNFPMSKTSVENFEAISEVLDGFIWTVTTILGHICSDERQLQMRDGLLELLVAYQVIHRLRDLFALYDRPQVEGSPFPSSILLSIQFLVVLTSRPETNCLIDWESLPTETVVGNGMEEEKVADAGDTGYVPMLHSGDCRPSLTVLSGSKVVHLPDLPEDRPLDESYKINKDDVSVSVVMDGEKDQASTLEEVNNINTVETDVVDEPQKMLIEDKMKPHLHQKDEKHLVDSCAEQKVENILTLEQPVVFLLSAISETGIVSLPSLLTAVLLQANNRLSSEQASYVLPSNFEEVATGVLKVLNNLALLDIKFMQRMLARPDLKMEFFHLMSFLLSHCNSKWKVASDQVGLLLLESLLLLGHFALFHPGNQAVLRWGKSPSILHKVCDLPFVFFSDPELMPVLAGTLVAACYGCEQNKGLVQQEISVDMLLSLLKSCRNVVPAIRSNSNSEIPVDDSSEKAQVDIPLKSTRHNTRNTRLLLGRGGASGNSVKTGKLRSQKDSKATKCSEEVAMKHNLPAPETSSMMLHCRFPLSFIDRAELFFSTGIPSMAEKV
ncbi:hypothetical protein FNV43_RR20329 [Rhamnella rubrinervis]|uniref:S phase cyclin A-associated protein in the endoplasmic reticulum N-terminal domain-containing protein n=1 Tax=Rhamnella rubrinervis TaxID=2594499 RepID=A0A8K0DYI8_9ROSA|nr:hypothetical protein FNV43_RR20329 [Rhamnella rubrinervis]